MQRTFAFERGNAWTGVRKAGNGLRLVCVKALRMVQKMERVDGRPGRSSQCDSALEATIPFMRHDHREK